MTIEPLHALLGTWELTGRSAGADADDIFGTMTGSLILDGTVLQMAGTMRFGDFETDSLELVWADPDSGGVRRAHVLQVRPTPRLPLGTARLTR